VSVQVTVRAAGARAGHVRVHVAEPCLGRARRLADRDLTMVTHRGLSVFVHAPGHGASRKVYSHVPETQVVYHESVEGVSPAIITCTLKAEAGVVGVALSHLCSSLIQCSNSGCIAGTLGNHGMRAF
jgi:hypothetical protein